MANSTEEVYVPKFDFKYKVSIDEFYLKYMNQFECPNDWVYKAGAHANIYLDHFSLSEKVWRHLKNFVFSV